MKAGVLDMLEHGRVVLFTRSSCRLFSYIELRCIRNEGPSTLDLILQRTLMGAA